MKVTHDKRANAIYIRLSEGQFAHTQVINEDVLLNIDINGVVMGVELLGVSDWVTEPERADYMDITRQNEPEIERVAK